MKDELHVIPTHQNLTLARGVAIIFWLHYILRKMAAFAEVVNCHWLKNWIAYESEVTNHLFS